MTKRYQEPLPLPDKRIPLAVVLIGTFEIGISLLGLILVILFGSWDDPNSIAYLVILTVYGAMGAGLWAIQEWARFTSVVLHMVSIPYTLYTAFFLGWPSEWPHLASQLLIAGGIIFALTRPEIRHKFQTVVPKRRH